MTETRVASLQREEIVLKPPVQCRGWWETTPRSRRPFFPRVEGTRRDVTGALEIRVKVSTTRPPTPLPRLNLGPEGRGSDARVELS